MGNVFKRVLGFVAAIIIPFAAPAIAAAIGLSAAIGATAASALVGAGLGAVSSAVTGGDVGTGALMGGIGGGIGGYMTPATAAPATAASTAAAGGAPVYDLTSAGITPAPGLSTAPVDYSLGTSTAATGLSGATTGGAGLTLPAGEAATGLSSAAGFGPVDYSLASGAQFPTMGLNPATAGVGLRAADPGFFTAGVDNALATGTPIDYNLGAYAPPSTGLSVTSANPVTGGTQVTTGTGTYQSTTPISEYSSGSYVGPTGSATGGSVAAGTGTGATTPTTAKPTTFMDALSKVPGEIAKKFTDPATLADLTLRAAGVIAGSVIAGDGLSSEEKTLLDAQIAELRTLQQTNAGLFAQRLDQAQNLMGESKYFDPEYFGLQRARRAQTAAAKAKRAGLRGLEGAGRAAEARRFDLATARDVGSSFDQGYLTGVQGRLSTMQAGMNAMPTSYPSSMGDYTNLRGAYTAANQRAREIQGDIGNLFGSLTGGQRSRG